MNLSYKRMIEALKVKEKRKRKSSKKSETWFLYMLKCGDGSLYTGITNDVAKRLAKHRAGRGAKFTRSRLPLELVYEERCRSRSAALIREYSVKSFPKIKKTALIESKYQKKTSRIKRQTMVLKSCLSRTEVPNPT